MTLFDTHAHLDFPDFAADLDEVIERAMQAGIERIVTIGTDLASSRRSVELAERFPCVRAAVGWHPSHVAEAPPDIRAELRELALHPRVAAIGETGLDFSRLPGGAEGEALRLRQRRLFDQQLEIAAASELNVVVHQREAFEDVMSVMALCAGRVRGVFHCFVDSAEKMQSVLEIGGLVSFTGIATFKNGQNVRDTIAATPVDRLMLETDCPYLAPVPHRGKRCEPAHVADTARVAAKALGCSEEALAAATSATARAFFRGL